MRSPIPSSQRHWRADLRVPDGIGIVWAMRLQGVTQRERVTGSDGIYHIWAHAPLRMDGVSFCWARRPA